MKKSFTLIELIFVIVIVGIISAVAISRFDRPEDLQRATVQVINHIRYTQHLALIDDKFVANPDLDTRVAHETNTQRQKATHFFYKQYWQIFFQNIQGNRVYTIFSDSATNNAANNRFSATGQQNNEIAPNPSKPGFILTGRTDLNRADPFLNLTQEYNVNVSLTHCSADNEPTNHIMFDYFGRPFNGVQRDNNSSNPYRALIRMDRCLITLTDASGRQAFVCVEPVTGYVHKVDSNMTCLKQF